MQVHNAEMAEMTAHATKLQNAIAEYHASLFKKMAEVSASAVGGIPRGGAASAAAGFATPVTPAF